MYLLQCQVSSGSFNSAIRFFCFCCFFCLFFFFFFFQLILCRLDKAQQMIISDIQEIGSHLRKYVIKWWVIY